jgi:hypothetical protein
VLFLPPAFLPAPLRADEPLLDLRAEDLRPPLLRPDFFAPRRDDFLPRDDLRALPARDPVERFRAPPLRPLLLRPEDPDRDRFLAPLRLLDFLAAAMGNSV